MRFLFLFVPALAIAQAPTVGSIEVFGNRKVPASEVRSILEISEGSRFPRSKAAAEQQIQRIRGVAAADVTAVCCGEDRKLILYIGIAENEATSFSLRPLPDEEIEFPEELSTAYFAFLSRLRGSIDEGNAGEDLSEGHSLLKDPVARGMQKSFVELADKHAEVLRSTLRASINEEHRAIAAYLIGYSSSKGPVIPDLQAALRDPDPTVRDNAARSLSAIAVLADNKPELGLKVILDPFVDMLNSASWTDRNRAALTLATLTAKRDESILELVRSRSTLSLIEMARWKNSGHALPAYILLGRAHGISEDALQKAWQESRREEIISRAAASLDRR
ncbi:MAG TPA: HEAT repeat domain-containing protein [Bryobacteraceae bacterium]|nr:HEAT repeat domain-containing protein [Bryobacteraceae bacterium]